MTNKDRLARENVQRLLNIAIREPSTVSHLPESDLDLLLRLARRARLQGRLGESIAAAGALDTLPSIAADQLTSAMVVANARARLALWELNRIAWAMGSDTETPLVAMKGCTYLLLDLPNSPGRVFADVDLMTAEVELERVEAILNAKGWTSSKLTPYDQNYYRKWTHELPPLIHEAREVEIDLHHNIMPRTARLSPSSRKLLDNSRQIPNSRYRVLADEDIVLHAMSHLMFDGDLADKLRDLVDIHDLVMHFSSERPDFWVALATRAVEMDLARPAFYSIRYVRTLLKASVPIEITQISNSWAPPRPVVWLMDRLVPRALYPQHPDRPSKITLFCRLLLYVRSHWIRMPPWLLAYHLGYKFLFTRLLKSSSNDDS